MFAPALALAAALMVQAVATPSPVQPTAGASTAGKSASDQVVCRSVTDTGPRVTPRTCHTAAEWNQISSDAQSSTSQYQRASSLSGATH